MQTEEEGEKMEGGGGGGHQKKKRMTKARRKVMKIGRGENATNINLTDLKDVLDMETKGVVAPRVSNAQEGGEEQPAPTEEMKKQMDVLDAMIQSFQKEIYPQWKFNFIDDQKFRANLAIFTFYGHPLERVPQFPWVRDLLLPTRMFGEDKFLDRSTLPSKNVTGLMFLEVHWGHIFYAEQHGRYFAQLILDEKVSSDMLQKLKKSGKYPDLPPLERTRRLTALKPVAQECKTFMESMRAKRDKELVRIVAEVMLQVETLEDLHKRGLEELMKENGGNLV